MDKRTLPAQLDSLADLRRYAREAGLHAGLDDSRVYQLQLAVDEIATNIIMYGYQGRDAAAEISIVAETVDETLRLTLEDRAPAFDPQTIPLPQAAELAKPLDERPIGGLGLFLVNLGVDRYVYRHENGCNLNVFEIRLRRD
jgi:anti-sigma regulatory factor (Ser/Thr protein kinase)